MKHLVETTGNFMLLDLGSAQEIDAFRPTVVRLTEWMGVRISKGELKVVAADLKDEATDAEFVTYMKEMNGDAEAAVASFLSKFGKDAIVAEEPAPAKRGRKA